MHDNLIAKGWTEQEVSHLNSNFPFQREAKVLVIFGFILMIAAVVAVPYAYGYIGQILSEPIFQITLLMVAMGLGASFGILLTDFDSLDRRHHVAMLVIIPIFTVVTTTLILARLNLVLDGIYTHNPLIGGLIYTIGFIAPYAFLVKQQWNSKIGRLNT